MEPTHRTEQGQAHGVFVKHPFISVNLTPLIGINQACCIADPPSAETASLAHGTPPRQRPRPVVRRFKLCPLRRLPPVSSRRTASLMEPRTHLGPVPYTTRLRARACTRPKTPVHLPRSGHLLLPGKLKPERAVSVLSGFNSRKNQVPNMADSCRQNTAPPTPHPEATARPGPSQTPLCPVTLPSGCLPAIR